MSLSYECLLRLAVVDVIIRNLGTTWLFEFLAAGAQDRVHYEPYQLVGSNRVLVDHRYARELEANLREDGFMVQRRGLTV